MADYLPAPHGRWKDHLDQDHPLDCSASVLSDRVMTCGPHVPSSNVQPTCPFDKTPWNNLEKGIEIPQDHTS